MVPREKLNEVVYFQSYGNYVKVFYTDNRHDIIRTSLKALDSYLPKSYFCRIHYQYIVHLKYIEEYFGNAQGLVLSLQSIDQKIKVSRKHISNFKKQFSDFKEADILFSKNDPGYFF